MDKIIEEKQRQRTFSEHTLDGAIITNQNEIIKDKNLLKKVLLKPLTEESRQASTELATSVTATDISPALPVTAGHVPNGEAKGAGTEGGDFGKFDPNARKISAPGVVGLTNPPRNKLLDRVRGVAPPVGSGPALTSSNMSLGRRKRTTSNASELWRRGDFGSRSNMAKEGFKKEIARPVYRQDIFFTGSIASLAQFQSQRSIKSFVDSQTSIPEPEPEEVRV